MSGSSVVHVDFNKKVQDVPFQNGAKVEEVLRSMGLYPDAHIVLRGRTPIPMTEVVTDGEQLRVIKVASGG
jgi:sulfur carrier protein ThiS